MSDEDDKKTNTDEPVKPVQKEPLRKSGNDRIIEYSDHQAQREYLVTL